MIFWQYHAYGDANKAHIITKNHFYAISPSLQV